MCFSCIHIRLLTLRSLTSGSAVMNVWPVSAMWGIHDRLLTLRNALHDTLTKAAYKDNLYRRWRWQQTLVNQQVCAAGCYFVKLVSALLPVCKTYGNQGERITFSFFFFLFFLSACHLKQNKTRSTSAEPTHKGVN